MEKLISTYLQWELRLWERKTMLSFLELEVTGILEVDSDWINNERKILIISNLVLFINTI